MTDFLISYNKADLAWAEWIAWQLEEAGFTTLLQAWDFRPGSNFVLETDRATKQAERTIAALSPDYLKALYTQPEWAAAFAEDPTGEKGKLLPIRVRECRLEGLLKHIILIDLVGSDEETAKKILLKGIQHTRTKPTSPPGFPGEDHRTVIDQPPFPGGIFMAPDLPQGFVERPTEFGKLLNYVLDLTHQSPIAITTALQGAGGFGKTTIAAALCHDQAVKAAFRDGILWVTLGEQPNVQEGLTKLYAALTGERPGFIDAEDASIQLAEKLKDKIYLIIIDDVWNAAHLRHFLRGGEKCTRLITTRSFGIAARGRWVKVDEMRSSEAVQMLKLGLDAPLQSDKPLYKLAQRLGEWPLMLELASATLRQHIAGGYTVEGAIQYLNEALDEEGVVAFDQRNPTERNQAIAKTIEVSLKLLDIEERERYVELVIFHDDTDIPLSTVSTLWGLSAYKTLRLCEVLRDLSLLKLDPQAKIIRLHDVMRDYLAKQLAHPESLHSRLVAEWGNLHRLPDQYSWRWVAYHLMKAGEQERLKQKLLLDFNWMQAKLDATDITELIADYNYLPDDDVLRLVQGAVRLATNVVTQDKRQLASQLIGRLLANESQQIKALLMQARGWKAGPWLCPLTPGLTPPGGPLIRTLSCTSDAKDIMAITPDGQQVMFASAGRSIKILDIESGKEVQTVRCPDDYIGLIAIAPNGRLVVSVSGYNALKVWELESRREVLLLRGNEVPATALAITPDSCQTISGLADGTLKVWEMKKGEQIWSARGHKRIITALAYVPDGRLVSASADGVIKVWELETGKELRALQGSNNINPLAVAPNGRHVVFISGPGALEVWDIEKGERLSNYAGIVLSASRRVNALAITSDGQHVIAGREDGDLKVWELETGKEVRTLRGHDGGVTALAILPDSHHFISVSKDNTIKVWNLEGGKPVRRASNDDGIAKKIVSASVGVKVLVITPDERRVISGRADGIIKLLDLETGKEVRTLNKNYNIETLAITPNGLHVVCGLVNGALNIWELETGKEVDNFLDYDDMEFDNIDGEGKIRINEAITKTSDEAANSVELFSELMDALKDKPAPWWNRESEYPHMRKLSDHFDKGKKAGMPPFVTPPDIKPDKVTMGGIFKNLYMSQKQQHDSIDHVLYGGGVKALAITPDGWNVIVGRADGIIKVRGLQYRTVVRLLGGHKGAVTALAITPDGKHFISASRDGDLKVWDFLKWKEVRTMTGFHEAVTALAITPDGQYVISGCVNGNLKIWEWKTGEKFRTLHTQGGAVTALAILPDGRHFISISSNNTLKLWDIDNWTVVGIFFGENTFTCASVAYGTKVIAGDSMGRVHILQINNLPGRSLQLAR
jgi:WD40 repeat protein